MGDIKGGARRESDEGESLRDDERNKQDKLMSRVEEIERSESMLIAKAIEVGVSRKRRAKLTEFDRRDRLVKIFDEVGDTESLDVPLGRGAIKLQTPRHAMSSSPLRFLRVSALVLLNAKLNLGFILATQGHPKRGDGALASAHWVIGGIIARPRNKLNLVMLDRCGKSTRREKCPLIPRVASCVARFAKVPENRDSDAN